MTRPRRATAGSRASRQPSLPGPGRMIDLSWKDGGSSYPKRSSRVGPEYQATSLPTARGGTKEDRSSDDIDSYCDLIWDPNEGENVLEYLRDKVPHNKKEEALAVLHANDYSVERSSEAIRCIKPIDGLDWSDEEKRKFHSEIFRLRKDMTALSQSMNKSMKSCLAYYLGTFKKSDDYRLLKTVCVEERQRKAALSAPGYDACAICCDGGSLLICDGCEGEYHMGCLRPALRSIPDGKWECDECVDQKFLDAREYIIRYSDLYESIDTTKKRKADSQCSETNSDDSRNHEIMFRPRSPVLKVMKTLATNISKTLADAKPKTVPGDVINQEDANTLTELAHLP